MMGKILAKMKEIWTGQPERDYDEDDREYDERENQNYTQAYTERDDDDDDYEAAPTRSSKRSRPVYGDNVVSIHTTAQLQVVIVRPSHFDEVITIADHLNSKRTVVLNLENTSKDIMRRLLDFLNGVAYANESTIQKIAANTYIITPITVDLLETDVVSELESSGVYF